MKELIRKSKGITLVALVITIIILLILAGISISELSGQGLFAKAIAAKENNKIAELEEKLKTELYACIASNQGFVDVNTYINYLKSEEVIDESDVEEEIKDITYNVTMDGEYIFLVEEQEKNKINIEYNGKTGKILPKIKGIQVLEKTTNSIKVEVSTKYSEGAIYKYYIKGQDEEYGKEKAEIKGNIYEFTGLIQDKKYTVKVRVTTSNGSVEKETEVSLGEIKEIELGSFSPATLTNGNVTVTLPIEEGYTTRYTIDGTIPTTSSTQYTAPFTVSRNQTIIYCYSDGTNISKDYKILEVNNIDKEKPTINTTLNILNVSTNSMTMNFKVVDEDSGISKIVWYYKPETETQYISESEINENAPINGDKLGIRTEQDKTKTFSNLINGTYNVYVEIYDVAGNITRMPETGTKEVVLEKYAWEIKLSQNDIVIDPSGDIELEATVLTDKDIDKEIIWENSDTNTLKIEITNTEKTKIKITGLKTGTATITASLNEEKGLAAKCTVTVAGVVLNSYSENILVGNTKKLEANIIPTTITNKKVTWSSSDTSVATVTNGTVTGIKAGTCKITATSEQGNYEASCVVIVTDSSSGSFVKSIKATNYGDKVNYTSPNGLSDWRVFYNDGSYVYLITSDYVPKELITAANPTVVAVNHESWPYGACWIWETLPNNLCSYTNESINLSKMYTLNNNYQNSRAVSSLLHTEYWESFVNTTYADIAIGSPTVEMFVESWNSNVIGRNLCWHTLSIPTPNQYGYYPTTKCGNQLTLPADKISLYFIDKNDPDTGCGRWLTLASPSNYDGTGGDQGEGYVLAAYSYYYNVYYLGTIDGGNAFRPIVRIKNSMTGTYNGDSWTLR